MTSDVQLQPMTAEEFDAWVLLPENHDRNFEFIAGEIIEVVSNNYASRVGSQFTIHIGAYLLANNIGYLTGSDGGYIISGERCIPDVAYVSYVRQPERSFEAYNPIPPDLVIEVISNPDNAQEMETLMNKITAYLAAGTTVWVANYKSKTVTVHAPGKRAEIIGIEGTLDGGDILPGFTLPVKNVFP